MTRRSRAAAAALSLVLMLAAPAAAHALRWRRCADFDTARCSTLPMPLDRTGVDPGQVRLRLADLGGSRRRPVLMYLSGGPGGAGVSEMVQVMQQLPELTRRYRVIGFDQRGTGRSGLLRCPEIERNVRLNSSTAAAACAQRLGAARRHYTTPDSVADMEAIRQALGVPKLTLFGISYGTELALEYARAHPDHVARLILDSVLDPDDRDPFVLASYRAMTPTLHALCPAGCRGISPDPVADLATLVARLRAKPALATAYDAHGRPHRRRIDPTALVEYMFDADYDTALRAALPAAVRAALAGDAAPLARLLSDGDVLAPVGPPRDFSSARYATVCEETALPWDPGTPIDARQAQVDARAAALGAAAFAPFDRQAVEADEVSLCRRWPDVPRPVAPVETGPYPAVPTLILQGGEDLRTPPADSAHVAALIPGAIRVVVPGVGHAVTAADASGCGVRALLRFVAGASVDTTCRRVPTHVLAVPPPPTSFAALASVAGLPPRVGRTVRATLATLADLFVALPPVSPEGAGGGLRGGSWALSDGGRRVVLRRYVTVPGVTLTGSLSRIYRLRIGGRQAAHGLLKVSTDGRLSGRLGGRRIGLQLGSAAAVGGALQVAALPRRVRASVAPRRTP